MLLLLALLWLCCRYCCPDCGGCCCSSWAHVFLHGSTAAVADKDQRSYTVTQGRVTARIASDMVAQRLPARDPHHGLPFVNGRRPLQKGDRRHAILVLRQGGTFLLCS